MVAVSLFPHDCKYLHDVIESQRPQPSYVPDVTPFSHMYLLPLSGASDLAFLHSIVECFV